MSDLFVGIDLGTTFSLAAVVQNGAPVPVPNACGEILTPSAVSLDATGTVLVGAPARARAVTHPHLTATAFKRDMGTTRVFRLGDREFRPEELSALVLRQLANDVEAAMGRPITEAVVTVPAYFGELQRRATRDACELAGLQVQRIINEPTAAALAYGLQHVDRELRAIVLDLGGGTFDVSVLEIIVGVVEIQASAGDARLGGEDFARMMVDRLRSEAARTLGVDADDPHFAARLYESCERAKKSLSRMDTARISVFDERRGRVFERELSRELVETWWRPLTARLRAPTMSALRSAAVDPSRIDTVLLVGGSTRMPLVRRFAAELFGVAPRHDLPADEAVALGAAVRAALKADDGQVEDLVVTDVAPFSLGIAIAESVGHRTMAGVFSPIIDRGTVLPASRVQRFSTIDPGQTELHIEVYQGEHAMCRDNQRLGAYTIERLPPQRRSNLLPIDVRFTYDLNGLLEVDATIPAADGRAERVESFVIEREPGVMNPDEFAAAREAMARLKFHPRDALPNVVALERAEALHVQLLGDARASLQGAIVAFLAALEGQDPDAIRAARETLNALTLALGRALEAP